MSDHMLVLVEDYNNKNLEISRLEAQVASQQRELDALRAVICELNKMVDDAEVVRVAASNASAEQDKANTILESSENPNDRRTKAWKDYENAHQSANQLWWNFNNAIRNIGLKVHGYRLAELRKEAGVGNE